MDPTKPILGTCLLIQIYTPIPATAGTIATITTATVTYKHHTGILKHPALAQNTTVLNHRKKYLTAISR